MSLSGLVCMAFLIAAPQIEASEQTFDFGYSLSARDYRHTFKIYNRGDEALHIDKIRTFCNCTVAQLGKSILLPGDSTFFDFLFDSRAFFAERVKWAYILSDDPDDPLAMVNVTIRLYEDYDRIPFKLEPQQLDFGSADSPKDTAALRITNPTQKTYNLELVEVPSVLESTKLAEDVLSPGEEMLIPFVRKKSSTDIEDFKSSVTLEAWTATEVIRFSVPLFIRP